GAGVVGGRRRGTGVLGGRRRGTGVLGRGRRRRGIALVVGPAAVVLASRPARKESFVHVRALVRVDHRRSSCAPPTPDAPGSGAAPSFARIAARSRSIISPNWSRGRNDGFAALRFFFVGSAT